MSGLFWIFGASGYFGIRERIFCTDTDIFYLFKRPVKMDIDNRRFQMIKKSKRGEFPFLEMMTNIFIYS